MQTFRASELAEIGARIFRAAGSPETVARRVSDSLVLSNLLGVDSHGVMRISQYVGEIETGGIVPSAEPVVARDNGIAVLMNGQNAFGQIVAERAMRLAIERARQHTVSVVSFGQVLHVGRLGEWAVMAGEAGLFGLVLANGSKPGGSVAPFGSRQSITGTNPIAFAIPAGSRPPVVADFSTAAAAEGRVRAARNEGNQIPRGWVMDKDGRPTTNPADLYNGGALRTFGEHKGYSLSLMIDVLAGILSGANTPIFPGYERFQNGVFILVVDVTFFRPAAGYDQAVDYLFDAVKRAVPIPGVESVLLPGEPESKCREERERNGIPVDDSTWAAIRKVAEKLNVPL
ncbi:MAG: Ldh family oxidoreductase [Chloroflexi bacterium]|nr:Ldh family oxidoreductase [Chloroflexota bacterium]